ncbi:hypothetical protein DI270_017360 [Microbispora triticiradicis]|uniref:HK97 gp10 family phage protein n=1 Tax=Microbispora triticiradicis TaxID=2200763 RepID=A0ABX9LKL5_9ACTN|nr:phage virion morphogenesis protein [Microbispora triticiradicis]RGA03659.1 hypothetical protein DI270_017360 [Microbispora triticiradicis]GLW22941.1 hypothetical protein Mame01_29840 [Microbispora amethystogenes]
MRFTMDFFGDRTVDRKLVRFQGRVRDASPAFEQIADDFLRIEEKQFATQGGHASGGWVPLSPNYAAWKAKHYPGKLILQRESDLVESLTRGPEIRIVEPDQVILGTAVPYAQYHQHGGERLPARPPIALTEADKRRWIRYIQKYLVNNPDQIEGE